MAEIIAPSAGSILRLLDYPEPFRLILESVTAFECKSGLDLRCTIRSQRSTDWERVSFLLSLDGSHVCNLVLSSQVGQPLTIEARHGNEVIPLQATSAAIVTAIAMRVRFLFIGKMLDSRKWANNIEERFDVAHPTE